MRIDFVSFCIDFVRKKNPSFCIDLMSLTKINGSGKSTNEKINHHFFAHCSSVNLNRTAIRSFTWRFIATTLGRVLQNCLNF